MNAFIVHSSGDKSTVKEYIRNIRNSTNGFNALILDNGGPLWKLDARKKIQAAQVVIFFLGETSHLSKYIGWEIRESIKQKKKIICIKLNSDYRVHSELKLVDRFSGEETYYASFMSIDEVKAMINSYMSGEYKLLNRELAGEDTSIFFEQYRLFLETSETLVERRQSVNNFYIMANTLLVTLAGTITALEIGLKIKMFIAIVFSVVGVILSFSWINILASYGNLNSSKMKIISLLERELPASLFDTEWEVLSDALNDKKYVSFTESEKRIPRMFIAVYFITIIAMSTLLLLN